MGDNGRELWVGTSGWTIPRAVRDRFEGEGTHLERYARRFSCVEITSSFYRPHRPATYERWARSVPADFRFALKLPKTITHERRLCDPGDGLDRFLDESAPLAEKRAVLLVQLPPSLAYEPVTAAAFFTGLTARYSGGVACEPRHASWFAPEPDALLAAFGAARVAADPAPVPAAAWPGGALDFTYRRMHGSPRMYASAYEPADLAALAGDLRASSAPAWCIFDNTALGAAAHDALQLQTALTGAEART